MDKDSVLLLLAGALIGLVIWLFLNQPLKSSACFEPGGLKPIIEEEDNSDSFCLNSIIQEMAAIPRPLIEYPNTALNYPLIQASSKLEEHASTVLPRFLLEYADNTLSLALESLMNADFSQVKPHPLIEYAEAGSMVGLSAPEGLLKKGVAVP